MNKTAIIIRGPAAVGKSTVAALLHEQIEHSAHVDVDLLKRMIGEKSSTERTEVAHATALSFIEHLASRNFSIIVEEIFRDRDLLKLKEHLVSLGYQFMVFFLSASLEELVARDAGRTHKNK